MASTWLLRESAFYCKIALARISALLPLEFCCLGLAMGMACDEIPPLRSEEGKRARRLMAGSNIPFCLAFCSLLVSEV
jgi:hypothetical protein